jgi:hypothetical protein
VGPGDGARQEVELERLAEDVVDALAHIWPGAR